MVVGRLRYGRDNTVGSQRQVKKTFLGFGLGAVQSGLMLFEAHASKNFERYVILEINEEVVDAVRRGGNAITVNTAGAHGIVKSVIAGIEIYNPLDRRDHDAIDSAIFHADEMATAVPSVEFYDVGGNSIARLLAKNVNPDKPQIVYAAENNNYAAEILIDKMRQYTTAEKLRKFQTINTVIGKMGGVVSDTDTICSLGLDLATPFHKGAVLVEEFNNIIISRIALPNFKRGIEVFQEKNDLLPFEEAKLFGHNAVHTMLGFLADLRGYSYMSEIRGDASLLQYGLEAFTHESGELLLRKYRDLDDPLFTVKGFHHYGEDLLERMTNPYLRDEVKRICRDPVRKMGYNDRLFGAIREALRLGVHPRILAKGVLGGICYLMNNPVADSEIELPQSVDELNDQAIRTAFLSIWKERVDQTEGEAVIRLICGELDEFVEEFVNVKE